MDRFDRVRATFNRLAFVRQPQYLLGAAAGAAIVWAAVGGTFHVDLHKGVDATHVQPDTLNLSEPAGPYAVKPASYLAGAGLASNAGIIGTVTIDADCAESGCGSNPGDSCCESTALRHERADYVVEPPDILSIVVHADRADAAVVEKINGEHLIGPDGCLSLGDEATRVHVAGLTLGELPECIHDRLQSELPDAEVCVSVYAQNSKMYYIISQHDAAGDMVARYPSNGGETVRTALSQMPGVDWTEKQVWIARPVPGNRADEILAVHALEIMAGTDLASDYSLEPGDRIFVANPPSVWQVLSDAVSSAWETLFEVF